MRDHFVSRLWWQGYFATKVNPENPKQVFEILNIDSDYRLNLLDRTSSSNATNVVTSVLQISKEFIDKGTKFERDKFRDFMKQIDFLGKRTRLPSLSAEQLDIVIRPLYASAYGIKEKKSFFRLR